MGKLFIVYAQFKRKGVQYLEVSISNVETPKKNIKNL